MDGLSSQYSTSQGSLYFNVIESIATIPIPDAQVTISYSGAPDQIIETLTTDSSGQTEIVTLPAPPLEYSQIPNEPQPYSQYNFTITADGYEPLTITNAEILPDVTAIQPIELIPIQLGTGTENILIPPHTLYGEYPPKIPEAEIKPVNETGEIVLSRVVIPEYVVVHDGVPDDRTAADYYVPYKDYIKNVVSCEIYATWPESTIYANTLAIMSFTLNRVYTEWYRNKGYNFTITSSTAYDQKFVYGKNIFANIDRLVENIFSNYLSRPGVRQPIFTSYCDGQRVTCNGLSQWGSKYLGDNGLTAIDIIHNYYGDDMFINTSEIIEGVPSSWPGYNLTIGDSGAKILQLQQQLNRISQNYPAILRISEDGIYGELTATAVRQFQKIFNLSQTGITDYATWYAISNIYVGVTKIAEPF